MSRQTEGRHLNKLDELFVFLCDNGVVKCTWWRRLSVAVDQRHVVTKSLDVMGIHPTLEFFDQVFPGATLLDEYHCDADEISWVDDGQYQKVWL